MNILTYQSYVVNRYLITLVMFLRFAQKGDREIMFFDIFTDLCKEKGVSRTKAAEEIGLSNSITTKWKKTGATPGGDTLEKVATYFGVSIDRLLGKEEKENSPDELVLTEGEKKLIQLLRQFPADRREFAVNMVISALDNMPIKDS